MQYTFNRKTRFIPLHIAENIERWTKKALTRRRFVKFISVKKIADLRYPIFKGDQITFTDEYLFSEEDISLILDYDREGRNRRWNNNWVDIGNGNMYQGQWRVYYTKNTVFMNGKPAECDGIGTIKFADGSIY